MRRRPEVGAADTAQAVEPQETLRRAAQLMAELDVAALPVRSGDCLLGIVTDRDLAVGGSAAGLDPDQACVSDVMTGDAACSTPDRQSDAVLPDLQPPRTVKTP